jgi:hypothetical protein
MRIAAAQTRLGENRLTANRSSIFDLFAGRPAVTLMFIDDSHGLHEGVANG